MSAAIDLGDALADLATALRVPVLVVAVLILLLCALELGRFGAELWRRRVRARELYGEKPCGVETPVEGHRVMQTAKEQARSCEQRQAQRHLAGDE